MKKLDLTNKIFGYLTVLNESEKLGKRGEIIWDCICICGTIISVYSSNLTKKNGQKSCGCTKGTHRNTINSIKTKEYSCWTSMRARCFNEKLKDYIDYGGRGITVCDRWANSFENFLSDMGVKPSSKHSLDRINNNGNYEPSNCRWATQSQQSRNQRTNVWLELNGVKMIMVDWAAYFKIHPSNLYTFIKNGKNISDMYYYYLNKKGLEPLF